MNVAMLVLRLQIVWTILAILVRSNFGAHPRALDIPHDGLDLAPYILHESNVTDYKGNNVVMFLFQPHTDKFVSYSMLYEGWWEGQLNKLYQTLLEEDKPAPEMVTLDLGANLGAFSLYAASLGRTVYSFEMQPDVCRLLEMSRRMNGYDKMIVHNAALWSESGKELSFTPLKGNRGGTQISSDLEGATKMQSIRVDEFIKDMDVFFLKIDVENAEEQVLKGMDSHLTKGRVRHLVIETRKNQIHIMRWLYEIGFRCGYFSRRRLFPIGTLGGLMNRLGTTDYLDLYCNFVGNNPVVEQHTKPHVRRRNKETE